MYFLVSSKKGHTSTVYADSGWFLCGADPTKDALPAASWLEVAPLPPHVRESIIL